MIRAGWVVQYRLHGVLPAGTGKGCNLEINAGEPGLRIQVEFQMKTPTFPAKILKGVSTLKPGTSEQSRFEGKPVSGRAKRALAGQNATFWRTGIGQGPLVYLI